MMCTTPAAVPGWRRVSVTPGINLMTGGDGPAPTFHVLPIPEVIAAAPLFGPTAGGNRVTFTGLGTLTLGNVACMFDGEVKEARAISATDVECTVPAHEPGVIQVSIVHSAFADGIGPHGLAVALGSPRLCSTRARSISSTLEYSTWYITTRGAARPWVGPC